MSILLVSSNDLNWFYTKLAEMMRAYLWVYNLVTRGLTDCQEAGISSGPYAPQRVWDTFTFTKC